MKLETLWVANALRDKILIQQAKIQSIEIEILKLKNRDSPCKIGNYETDLNLAILFLTFEQNLAKRYLSDLQKQFDDL